jgi:HAD superfamily hydrolase (TIGR01509 family)
MESLQALYKFEIPQDKLEMYVTKEEDKVIAKLDAKARPCIGATEELEKVYNAKKYGLTVVSSSALRRVIASIKKVGQDKYLDEKRVFSAASSLPKPTSKPNPAIYLHALEQVGKRADESVAIEDSKSGVLSAIRAGIPVIAYVGSYNGEATQKEMAQTLTDLGARCVMYNWSDFEKCLKTVEEGAPTDIQSCL